jgi:hypothetical protein
LAAQKKVENRCYLATQSQRRFLSMQVRVAMQAMLLTLVSVAPTSAAFRISDDQGGQSALISPDITRCVCPAIKLSLAVPCASACTMLLDVIPRNPLRDAARRARFSFGLDTDLPRRTDQQRQ